MARPWHLEAEGVRIRKVCVGRYENNAYVLAEAAGPAAVLVDAADDADTLVAACADLDVRAILTTHGHHDHIGAARAVADRLDVPFLLHPEDEPIAGIAADGALPDGVFAVGALEIRVMHTPGHTPGSSCFVVPGVVLSGDTLFPGGPGATRFPYADFATIIESLETGLFTFPDETIVMPGHGLDTTIGTERPHLAEWRERGW